MRSHVTPKCGVGEFGKFVFQYRKRYEITCDWEDDPLLVWYEFGFNTASGMRSHVTEDEDYDEDYDEDEFQYRKRYEITCDISTSTSCPSIWRFQYRKRYEITCDPMTKEEVLDAVKFQYRKRYEITCDL